MKATIGKKYEQKGLRYWDVLDEHGYALGYVRTEQDKTNPVYKRQPDGSERLSHSKRGYVKAYVVVMLNFGAPGEELMLRISAMHPSTSQKAFAKAKRVARLLAPGCV